jgi:type I restriction enzyme, S subunit
MEPFDAVVIDETGGNAKTPQAEFQVKGRFPIVDQGEGLVAGFTDDETRLCRSRLPVIVFGDHTRRFKFIDFPFCMGADGVKVLRPRDGVDTKYLFHYLQHIPLEAEGYARHFKYLRRALVAVPSGPDQRRIANLLDKAEALRAKRRIARNKLDTLTHSIFLDMFGDPATNPKGWPIRSVSEYTTEFQGGKSIEADRDEHALTRHRVLKVSAVTGMEFRPGESKPVPDDYEPPREHFVRVGDLLFSRANTSELVGAVALVDETPADLLLPDKLWRFVWRQPEQVDRVYVWALFQTAHMRDQLGRRATGTSGSMKNISQEKVFGIQTMVPPLYQQREFARRIHCLRKLVAQHRSALVALNDVFASLQHRAFRGEL